MAASTEGRPAGLSPRVRGKLAGVTHQHIVGGSIPACAGEANHRRLDGNFLTVYPRVCGGSPPLRQHPPRLPGLSPRVRGKRGSPAGVGFCQRSIPACAGEAVADSPMTSTSAVYPRVCGGSGVQ